MHRDPTLAHHRAAYILVADGSSSARMGENCNEFIDVFLERCAHEAMKCDGNREVVAGFRRRVVKDACAEFVSLYVAYHEVGMPTRPMSTSTHWQTGTTTWP